jgi:ParB-like nuclease domain
MSGDRIPEAGKGRFKLRELYTPSGSPVGRGGEPGRDEVLQQRQQAKLGVGSSRRAKKDRKSSKYEVVAGGRRLAALNLLIADGRLAEDHEVDCHVVGRQEAFEISLSENSRRVPSHGLKMM